MKRKKAHAILVCCVLTCMPLYACQSQNTREVTADAVMEEADKAASEETENNTDAEGKEEYTGEVFAMDTYMTLTACGENAREAVDAGIAEINRLDELLSTGNSSSEVYAINQNGGGEMSEDTAYLVERALELFESTGGAFDISVYPVMDLWGFTSGDFSVPDEESLRQKLSFVDAGKICVGESLETTVISMEEGMKIDLGGIAKGYASGRVVGIFREYGIECAVINLGGNVHVLGNKADGSQWKVGIQDPRDANGYLGGVSVTDKAVITSGGYERNFTDENTGVTYHHIIDPRTGYSANNGLISVTIISSDSTLADGLSTSLYVMGRENAITYCQEHCAEDGFDVIMEDENGMLYMTDGIEDSFLNLSDRTDIQIIETDK